jgi:hypothetical protein
VISATRPPSRDNTVSRSYTPDGTEATARERRRREGHGVSNKFVDTEVRTTAR